MRSESCKELWGKTAIITGGARNIGCAIGKILASRGASVVIVDICDNLKTIPYSLSSRDDLEQAVKEISGFGQKTVGLVCDVRLDNQVSAVTKRVMEEFGRIDILVNNAGVVSLYPAKEISEQAWDEVIDVCLKGTFLCCKYALPHMIEQHSGKIVNISSIAGKRGLGSLAHYCAAKHGVLGITRALAVELAEHNVNVNAICPGTVESPSLEGLASQMDGVDDSYEHFSRGHLFQDRHITPMDIARAVLWLVSEESRHITGASINVDAGWSSRA